MEALARNGLDIDAFDASGQRKFTIRDFSRTARIGDLIKSLIPQMGLNSNDSSGRPLDYQAFSKRSSAHLRAVDTVGDVLEQGDSISLLPDIQAGAYCAP